MNIFVTGASGFIGSHLVNHLKGKNKVVALYRDVHPPPWQTWLAEALEGCTLVRGDIQDDKTIRRVLAKYQIDQVYHLASQAIVSSAVKDPFGTFQTNVLGTVDVLEACRQVGVEKILVMSTDKVYGNKMDATESDPLISTGPYETSKTCADLIAQAYMKTYDMSIVIPRSCNAYGFDLSPRIVPNVVRSCLRGEPPVVYEGEETLRQYVFVNDLCEALTHLTKHQSYRGVYNIATSNLLTQKQVVLEICKYFPLSPRFIKRNKPIKEIQSQSMICSQFSWTPKHTFSQGIQETIQNFKQYGW